MINLELRSLIYGKYKSEAECARELKWTRQRLNKISNGTKIPDLTEVKALAEKLDITIGKMAQIFLNNTSPNEQQNVS